MFLAGCSGGSGEEGADVTADEPSATEEASAAEDAPDMSDETPSDAPSEEPADEEAGTPSVELVADGFGKRDDTVRGIAIVTSNDEAAVGEFVTVSMNFLDESGSIISTEEQVESLSWVGQELVLPVSMYGNDDGSSVASVETSVSVSDYGMGSQDPLPPLETVQSQEVTEGTYGGAVATFEMTNESDTDLEDLRIGVVCYDDSDAIVGGDSNYPGLLAAGQTIRLDVDVTVTGMPERCEAFPNYGTM